jgi:acetyl-CoA C-acetyltransferase
MTEAFICEPYRTPVGRFGGQFRSLSVQDLGAQLLRGLIERTKLPVERVDDVVFAHCYPTMDAPALGRVIALDAGLPFDVGGLQLDRRCGSGLQAVLYASMQVATGASELVIAGGADSMSNAPFYSSSVRWGVEGAGMQFHDALARGRVTAGGVNFPIPGGMIETAENLRRKYKIPRLRQDELAVESHRKAVAAQKNGTFSEEIIPIAVHGRKETTMIDRDEHPRADTSIESLSGLKPILRQSDPEATVTAGNASGQNDGAAAAIVTTPRLAEALGLRPYAKVISWAVAGVPPAEMGIGPVPASAKALTRAEKRMTDMDLIELNEAFAAQVLACAEEWKFGAGDFARTNVNGSGISLGHPVGATGARILATLLREMKRRGARYALETMCIGGGQGLAAVFERVGE